MATTYSLYPTHKQRAARNLERPATRTKDRPKASSVETSIRVPIGEPNDMGSAHGEPLVHDFQTHYMTGPAKAPELNVQSPSVSGSSSPTSPTFFNEPAHYGAPPPPDVTRRDIHIPSRTSSNSKQRRHRPKELGSSEALSSAPTTPQSRERSSASADSYASQDTAATSIHTLPPLQTNGIADDADPLEPLQADDPRNFDLLAAPASQATGVYQLERRAAQLLSNAHLELIFADPKLLLRFTGFLNTYRPQSLPILIYYLDALKALRAIRYANAIAEALDPLPGHDFTAQTPHATQNQALQEKANKAFDVLVREDLPAYITHTWIQVVSTTVQRRITGNLAPHLREASEGLAEVFCLSDPSRPDNPIVFASEEFYRTTQYGMSYAIGRNCRFLQGPRTDHNSVRRLGEAVKNAKEHSEVFLNYRRDGSPFMNLLMIAPLMDSKGQIRYFIGAQVDVSGLVKECTELDALARLDEQEENPELAAEEERENRKDELQSLTEMFNHTELEMVRKFGGSMHRDYVDDSDRESIASHRPRLRLNDPTTDLLQRTSRQLRDSTESNERFNGRLEGVYQNYLLVRPQPSLRILFTSPSLRVPGILQSPFLSRIGGSPRVRADLSQALAEGRGVTAKIRWLTRADDSGEGEGRSRWIHCTPLMGHSGTVGVWMIVLVDEEGSVGDGRRRFRPAPPVANVIGGKEYDIRAARERREHMETASGRNTPVLPHAHGVGYAPSAAAARIPHNGQQHVGARPGSVLSDRHGAQSELSFQLK